ncbi:FUSC family protein [Planococcus shenhongbingii]|uniref:FUSC family protein n=1 Tax=Planococcus shenhongbingii TaxID=3058398 RepID=UPI00262B5327|nr:FUSC family protein [Planococcus sp. N016]WKA56832.1 FUSC family protein [Planococcus sp. N016]
MQRRVRSAVTDFQQILKQAFAINNVPLPWSKAIGAGFCSAFPILVGLWLGYIQYGFIMSLGGLAFLYMFNEPYVLRAKKIFCVVLGLAFSAGLGTVLSANPILSAVAVGIIGASAVFFFGAYQFAGPSALFFILVFLINANTDTDPSLAILHATLVVAGGILSFLFAMAGWVIAPLRVETAAVKEEYRNLALLMDSLDSSSFLEIRQKSWFSIIKAENILAAGYAPWLETPPYWRLALLHKQAKLIYSEIVEYSNENKQRLPFKAIESMQLIESAIEDGPNESVPAIALQDEKKSTGLERHIRQAYDHAAGNKAAADRPFLKIPKTSFKTLFSGTFNKNSMIFFTALRFGIVLTAAALAANFFNDLTSYWIPLTCAAVMSGATILSTFNRAIQRTCGTILGIVIAVLILSLEPEGLLIVLAVFLLMVLAELAMVLNYAVAAVFVTPIALILAESTSAIGTISYFTSARLTDVLIGSAIGLFGTLLVGRRHASSLLPRLMAKTIRSQQRFTSALFSVHKKNSLAENTIEQRKMQTNLTNLRLVFSTAQGELSSNRQALESLQPVFFGLEQLSFLLAKAAKDKDRLPLADAQLAQLLLVFEMMANAAEKTWHFSELDVPHIPKYRDIEREIRDLQYAFKTSQLSAIN